MKTLIAGNWKMNLTPAQAVQLADGILAGIHQIPNQVEPLICPPFTALSSVYARIAGSPIRLGAQNMYPESKGAFTGEISAEMLLAAGCSYVICGHSERRHVLHESDEMVHRKVLWALESGLTPILCVGETECERERGLTFNVVERHVRSGLFGVSEDKIDRVVLAYEPVWAIGTGKTATPAQAEEVHRFIRSLLMLLYPTYGHSIRILYGGSVNPENIIELLAAAEVNGALIGGASLKSDSFLKMVRAADIG